MQKAAAGYGNSNAAPVYSYNTVYYYPDSSQPGVYPTTNSLVIGRQRSYTTGAASTVLLFLPVSPPSASSPGSISYPIIALGDAKNNVIYGSPGSDYITDGAGVDAIVVGSSNVVGAGNVVVAAAVGAESDRVVLVNDGRLDTVYIGSSLQNNFPFVCPIPPGGKIFGALPFASPYLLASRSLAGMVPAVPAGPPLMAQAICPNQDSEGTAYSPPCPDRSLFFPELAPSPGMPTLIGQEFETATPDQVALSPEQFGLQEGPVTIVEIPNDVSRALIPRPGKPEDKLSDTTTFRGDPHPLSFDLSFDRPIAAEPLSTRLNALSPKTFPVVLAPTEFGSMDGSIAIVELPKGGSRAGIPGPGKPEGKVSDNTIFRVNPHSLKLDLPIGPERLISKLKALPKNTLAYLPSQGILLARLPGLNPRPDQLTVVARLLVNGPDGLRPLKFPRDSKGRLVNRVIVAKSAPPLPKLYNLRAK